LKLCPSLIVEKENKIRTGEIEISSPLLKQYKKSRLEDSIAYPPFINSHDHLVGNWYPKAGTHAPYVNSHIWVKDMRESDSVKERNKFWVNDGQFNLLAEKPSTLVWLGVYKNIFSGVGTVQDHAPVQTHEYYQQFPINVIEKFRQCHSITLGNWWGGEEIQKEMELTQGKMPFIIHLGEGLDNDTTSEFTRLRDMGLLKNNTIIIHGISLTEKEIQECAKVGASISWCPSSNIFLIGKTIDIEKCLHYKVNIVIGTDSSLTGSENLFSELKYIRTNFPEVPEQEIYKMITSNSAKALHLSKENGILEDKTDDVLIVKRKEDSPFINLFSLQIEDVKLFMKNGIPLYGDAACLDWFNTENYEYKRFVLNNEQKFVFGSPQKYLDKINTALGYRKHLPFIPFS